jgi:hypothetical protein
LANIMHSNLFIEVSPLARRAALERIRLNHGLVTRVELNSWLADNLVDSYDFNRLVDAEARLAAAAQVEEPALTHMLIDELRLTDMYRALRARAERKLDACAAVLVEREALTVSPTVMELRIWFFHERLGVNLPESPEDFAQQLDFRDCHEFDSALRREWLFLKHSTNFQLGCE